MKTHYYLGGFRNFFPEQLGKAIQEDLTDRTSLVMISANPRSDEDEGTGLHNFSVLSHFDLENNMALVHDELALLSEEMDIYASNKDCALRVKGDPIDIFGDVYLMSNSEIRKLDKTLQA